MKIVLIGLSLILSGLGITLFTNGILLRHKTVETKSELVEARNGSFKKAIIIVFDALRFDSAVRNEKDDSPHLNNLPIFDDTVRSSPYNARLYSFMADPPTVTAARVRAIISGTIPSYVEMGDNFDSMTLPEDNIVHQFKAAHPEAKVAVFGDEVWTDLLPSNLIDKHTSFHSFDITNSEEFDEKTYRLTKQEIDLNESSLVVAHFLGLDHISHFKGVASPRAQKILKRYNQYVGDFMASMDQDTILFVMGDHGNWLSGDHGGGSIQECQTALFVYSPRPISSLPSPKEPSSVEQINFAATFSYLLGTPIPFSSIGHAVVDLSLKSSLSEGEPLGDVHFLVENARQVYRYIQVFNQTSPIPSHTVTTLFQDALHLYKEWGHNSVDGIYVQRFLLEFFSQVREVLLSEWNMINTFQIVQGLLLAFLSNAVLLHIHFKGVRLSQAIFLLLALLTLTAVSSSILFLITTLTLIASFHHILDILETSSMNLCIILLVILNSGLIMAYTFSFHFVTKPNFYLVGAIALIFSLFSFYKRPSRSSLLKLLSIVILCCVSLLFTRCQVPPIEDNYCFQPLTSTYFHHLFIVVGVLSVVSTFSMLIFFFRKQIFTNKWNVLLTTLSPSCLSFYSFLNLLYDPSENPSMVLLPLVVYILFLCSLSSLFFSLFRKSNSFTSYLVFLECFLSVVFLVSGVDYYIPLTLFIASLALLYSLKDLFVQNDYLQYLYATLLIILFNIFFIATGHHTQLTVIKWTASSHGLGKFPMVVKGIVVVIDTFSTFLIGTFSIPFTFSVRKRSLNVCFFVIILMTLNLLGVLFFTFLLRSNEKIFDLFLPHCLYRECIFLIVAPISALEYYFAPLFVKNEDD